MDAKVGIEQWRQHYNEVRPHSSLGYLTPAEFKAQLRLARMTEGARRQCRLALTRKNTETNDELQLALFSSNDWSEESRQVTLRERANGVDQRPHDIGGVFASQTNQEQEARVA